MTPQRRTDTRSRILATARDLYAEKGYAGTSMAALAGRLGISKAALYHHFASKTEILDALVAEPTAAWDELVARAPGLPAEELLGAVIDTTAGYAALADVLGGDPSVRSARRDRTRDRSHEINAALTAALAGGSTDPVVTARAHAAYAAAKHGALAAGRLTADVRAALLAAALRALRPD